MSIKTGFQLFLWMKQLSTVIKLESFKVFGNLLNTKQLPRKLQVFFSKYVELQNTSQQEIPPCSIGKLVCPHLFHGVNGTLSQNLLQKSIEKDTTWDVAGLPDKEKWSPILGSWTPFQTETAIENMKNLRPVTCQRFPTVENILFVKHIPTFC